MSQYIVSARKYRPHSFEEVVGQEHITSTLENAIKNDQLAQSFLFCGPRGVGKTTCARILAREINKDSGQPNLLGETDVNVSMNIFELDAASNNSVEDIRNLIDQVRFPPQSGKYKVYIIDEVHMLSAAAFNAFLKTLEEPPPYAIFILATTEKHKIIPTILSRCQIFDFRRITPESMVNHLKKICEEEGITADDNALQIIATKSDGALRDALSLFDRLISSLGEKHLKYEDVVSNLNILDYDYYFKVTDALLEEDLAASMTLFNEIMRNGFEGDDFMLGLGEHFRNLLVCKDDRTIDLLDLTGDLRERYRQQAAASSSPFLLNGMRYANECDQHYKQHKNKRLLVELTLAKICFASSAIQAATSAEADSKKKRLTKAEDAEKQPVKEESPDNLQKQQTTAEESEPKSDADEPSGSGAESGGDDEVYAVYPKHSRTPGTEELPPEEYEEWIDPNKPDGDKEQTEELTEEEEARQEEEPKQGDSQPTEGAGEKVINIGNRKERKRKSFTDALQEAEKEIDHIPTKSKEEEESEEADQAGSMDQLPAVEEIRKHWEAYIEKLRGEEEFAIAQIMEDTELLVEGNTLVGMLKSQVQIDMLDRDLRYLERFLYRAIGGKPDIEYRIDPEAQQNNSQPFTAKEKLDKLIEINPKIKDLKDQLGLDLEH
jgi:DNA polymerase-3 subunit gamma/tau